VYWVIVIGIVVTPSETLTVQTPAEDVLGSPRELKVNVIVVVVVTPDGSRPVGSKLTAGANE
jgi:hypothetical protein